MRIRHVFLTHLRIKAHFPHQISKIKFLKILLEVPTPRTALKVELGARSGKGFVSQQWINYFPVANVLRDALLRYKLRPN